MVSVVWSADTGQERTPEVTPCQWVVSGGHDCWLRCSGVVHCCAECEPNQVWTCHWSHWSPDWTHLSLTVYICDRLSSSKWPQLAPSLTIAVPMAGYQTVLQDYLAIPTITRAYTTACVLTTVAVQLDLVSPFQLYFNPILIFRNYQFWRLITTFLFFGSFGFTFLFNLIFTYRYCRMLEEGSFRSRTADFFYMFLIGGILMIVSDECLAES